MCVFVLVFLRDPLSDDGPGICEVALDGLGLPCIRPADDIYNVKDPRPRYADYRT